MDAVDIKRATEDQGHGGLLEHMGAWYRTWRHDCGRRSVATNAEEAGSSRTIEKTEACAKADGGSGGKQETWEEGVGGVGA
jgi:hypothetical protein